GAGEAWTPRSAGCVRRCCRSGSTATSSTRRTSRARSPSWPRRPAAGQSTPSWTARMATTPSSSRATSSAPSSVSSSPAWRPTMPDPTRQQPGEPREPDESWRFETRAIRAGREWSRDSLAPVLFPATTYEVASVVDHQRMSGTPRTSHYYSRFGSPSVQEFEAAVAALEGAEAALASASGMAAVTGVVLGLCSAGDHVVVQRQLFSVTSTLFTAHLPRFGIDVTFVDGTEPQQFADAVRPGRTQVVFVETPANPALSLTDIEAVASIPGPFTVVDSTFATPVVQQPLALGADLVVHAAT